LSSGAKRESAFGVRTTKTMKKLGCSNLKSLIEENKLLFNDYDIITELTTFIAIGESFSGEEGTNDDLVITLVLFAWLIDQQYFKDLSNQNIRDNLYQNQMNQLEDLTTPFGVIDNGLNKKEYEIDSDGTVWETIN